MPTGRNRDPNRRRKKYSTSLEKKAYWTTPVPEGTPKPGPKKKIIVYRESIDTIIQSTFLNEWRTGSEIAEQATKMVSKWWTPISVYVVTNYMRRYVADGIVAKRKPNTVKPYEYRRL